MPLHPTIAQWFASKNWAPRQHQLDVLATYERDASALLIAPTGAGKTLAGFLPSLNELTHTPREGLHTLYISPLKALAVDVARNLDAPITEMHLPVTVETRTGDTPASRRTRQRRTPPNILMTTPEQLALLLSHGESAELFCRPSPHRAGRAAFDGHQQARRAARRSTSRASRPTRPAFASPHSAPPSRGPISSATGSPHRCRMQPLNC